MSEALLAFGDAQKEMAEGDESAGGRRYGLAFGLDHENYKLV